MYPTLFSLVSSFRPESFAISIFSGINFFHFLRGGQIDKV